MAASARFMSYLVIAELIAAMRTAKGLEVEARLEAGR